MWYDNSVLMTFVGVIVGAIIGFVGAIIQSRITAKNNIDVVNAQSKKEIEQHRYMEKEKLYSELIGFLPQLSLAVDVRANRIHLTREQTVQLNSFKARLSIFANKEIYDEFYDLGFNHLIKLDGGGSAYSRVNGDTIYNTSENRQICSRISF